MELTHFKMLSLRDCSDKAIRPLIFASQYQILCLPAYTPECKKGLTCACLCSHTLGAQQQSGVPVDGHNVPK